METTNNFVKRTAQGWLQLDTHRAASDHISITGIPVRTRHADAQAIAHISVCASRRHPIEVMLLVGAEDAPGWRNKDGEEAQARRNEVAEDAAKHLGVDVRAIKVQARYSGVTLVGRSISEREETRQAAEQLGPTHYRVSLDPQTRDSRLQKWVSADRRETLVRTADLELAKAAFAKAWGEIEQHARAASAPIILELDVVTIDEDGLEEVETYTGDGNPAGDASWSCYYGGQDCTGWYVLWAHNTAGNYRGAQYDLNCLGIIGHDQARYCGTGEWELRHCQDKGGALYAEELHETREAMLAAIADNATLCADQHVLKFLSSGQEPVVQAERFNLNGDTYMGVILPDGVEFLRKLEDPAAAGIFYALSFDREAGKDVLVCINLAEVEETEEENA